jgi:homoserine O-acetyltransferase
MSAGVSPAASLELPGPFALESGASLPSVTVAFQASLLDALGVKRLRVVVGGSLGGMQALEWAPLFPDRADAIAPIAASARHSAWCIGLSEAQRQAIYADPRWRGGHHPPGDGPEAGLPVARQIDRILARFRRDIERDGGHREASWVA